MLGREGLVILGEREGGGRSQSAVVTSFCFQMAPAFSSAEWLPSSISSMPSLKIKVLCMLGVQRSTSESGRHITLDGDELWGRVCVYVCVCLFVCVCVCQILRENKPMERNVCVCDGKLHDKQGIHEDIVRAR